jgi:hypothetical protein
MREHFTVEGALGATAKLGSGRVTVEPAEPGGAWASVEPVDPGHEPSVRLAAQASITFADGELRVEVPNGGRPFRNGEVIVALGLPGRSELSVKGGAVDIGVRGGLTALSAKLGAGDVEIDEATEALAVKAGQTNVRVGTAGNVAVSTGQGSLRAERVGNTAFKTGQGDVELGRTDGAIAVKGGSVDLTVREAGPGDVAFTTGSGNASVGVATGTTVELDLLSGSGDVRCDLPMEATAPSGGAGLRLKLRTGSGNLHVAATSPV